MFGRKKNKKTSEEEQTAYDFRHYERKLRDLIDFNFHLGIYRAEIDTEYSVETVRKSYMIKRLLEEGYEITYQNIDNTNKTKIIVTWD